MALADIDLHDAKLDHIEAVTCLAFNDFEALRPTGTDVPSPRGTARGVTCRLRGGVGFRPSDWRPEGVITPLP